MELKNLMRRIVAYTYEEHTHKLALNKYNDLNLLYENLLTYCNDNENLIEFVKGSVSLNGLNKLVYDVAYEIQLTTQNDRNAVMSLRISYEPKPEDLNPVSINVARKMSISERIQALDW
jgi:hypothetical protein